MDFVQNLLANRQLLGLLAGAFALAAVVIMIVHRWRHGRRVHVSHGGGGGHAPHHNGWWATTRLAMSKLSIFAVGASIFLWGVVAFLGTSWYLPVGVELSAGDEWFHIVYGFVALAVGSMVMMLSFMIPFGGHGSHGHDHGHEDLDEHLKYNRRAWRDVFACQVIVWTGFGVLAARVVSPAESIWIWGLVFMGMAIASALADAFKIPEHKPPSKGQVGWFGFRPEGRIFNEQWVLLPLRWLGLFRVFLISVKQVHLDWGLPKKELEVCLKAGRPAEEMLRGLPVFTPRDKQKGRGRLGATLEPYDPKKIENIGGLPGVIDRFDDQLAQALWEWSTSSVRGPQTMDDLQQSPRLAVNAILRAILPYEALEKIPSAIPTEILLQYFDYPEGGKPPPVPPGLRRDWGPNWERVERELDAGATPRKEVEEKVRARAAMLTELSRSTCRVKIPDLGCYLVQLNWKGVAPTKAFAKAQAKWGIERHERRAEKLEAKHVMALIDAYTDAGATFEQARRLAMGERDKSEVRDTVFSLELGEGAKDLAKAVAANPALAAGLGAALGAAGAKGRHGRGGGSPKKGGHP